MYYKEIYNNGQETFNKKFDYFLKYNPDFGHEDDKTDFEIEEELEADCARSAFEDDGCSKVGFLSPEEIYYLLALYYDDETANEYLEEIEYFEIEAVA